MLKTSLIQGGTCMPRTLLSSRRRPLVVALAGLGLAVSLGCVSSGKYKTLQAERDDLAAKNKGLQADVTAANQKNQTLASENSSITSEKDALQKKVSDMEARGKEMDTQLQRSA